MKKFWHNRDCPRIGYPTELEGVPIIVAVRFIGFILLISTAFLISCSKSKKDVTEVLGAGITSTTGVISGKVTTTSYQVISGATIWTEPATYLIYSGNDGKYKTSGILAGTYIVKAWKTGYDIKSETVKVVAEETVTLNIKLSPYTSTGTTYGEISGVVRSETSSPVPNARVWTEPSTSTVYTDTYGNYKISNVSAGTYTLKAEMGVYPSVYQTSAPVTIAAGQKLIIDLVITFSGGGGGGGGGGSGPATVSGQVMINNSPPNPPTPAAGASIWTVPASSTTTSASDGTYTLSNIPASQGGTSYILYALKDGKQGQVNIFVYPAQSLTGMWIGIPP